MMIDQTDIYFVDVLAVLGKDEVVVITPCMESIPNLQIPMTFNVSVTSKPTSLHIGKKTSVVSNAQYSSLRKCCPKQDLLFKSSSDEIQPKFHAIDSHFTQMTQMILYA